MNLKEYDKKTAGKKADVLSKYEIIRAEETYVICGEPVQGDTFLCIRMVKDLQ